MDPDVRVEATAFFTVPGTVIAPFSVQMDIVTRATVPFGDLAVVHPVPVEARVLVTSGAWRCDVHAGRGRRGGADAVEVGAAADDDAAAPTSPDRAAAMPDESACVARIVPYPAPRDGLTLPLDTGQDSLFILGGAPDADHESPSPCRQRPSSLTCLTWWTCIGIPMWTSTSCVAAAPATSSTDAPRRRITLTPFRGPCLLVMPAGAFHRIVQTEDDQVGGGFLIYADRRAVVEPYATIMAATRVASLSTTD